VIALTSSFGAVQAVDSEAQVDFDISKVTPIELDQTNFYEIAIDKETNSVIGDKPWFIKFFAPWCGHCKNLAPTWEELADLTKDQMNVGKVDCTSADGKPLCTQFEVRGYPTLLLFPTEVIENGADTKQYYKYAGPRQLESLRSFALDGDWVNAHAEVIPPKLEGMDYYKAFASRTLTDMRRDIDLAVVQLGIDHYLPKPLRYFAAGSIFLLPVLLICVLLCCCSDEVDNEYPEMRPA